jgi:hypothetical protein
MSFSNTNTGDKPSDPYKKANEQETDLETKVADLVKFMTDCKFGMMTTHQASTSELVSRCMALAANVSDNLKVMVVADSLAQQNMQPVGSWRH